MMQQMIAPLQAEVQVQQREIELQKFKTAHPDLKEHRLGIAKLLNEREDLKLEDAYWLVKGRAAEAEAREARENKLSNRANSREGLYKTSTELMFLPRTSKHLSLSLLGKLTSITVVKEENKLYLTPTLLLRTRPSFVVSIVRLPDINADKPFNNNFARTLSINRLSHLTN